MDDNESIDDEGEINKRVNLDSLQGLGIIE